MRGAAMPYQAVTSASTRLMVAADARLDTTQLDAQLHEQQQQLDMQPIAGWLRWSLLRNNDERWKVLTIWENTTSGESLKPVAIFNTRKIIK